MIIPDSEGGSPLLTEATRELEAAIHDARVAFDCIGLGEIDRVRNVAAADIDLAADEYDALRAAAERFWPITGRAAVPAMVRARLRR